MTSTAGDATAETTTNLSAETDSAITVKTTSKDDVITMNADNDKAIVITDTNTSTDADIFDMTDAAAITLTKLTLSGIETITIDDSNGNGISINASAVSGQTIDYIGDLANDVLTLTGTADADVITLANATTSGLAVDFKIAAGQGADTIVLSAAGVAVETIVIGTAATAGSDTVTGFKETEDLIDVSGAATFLNGATAAGVDISAKTTAGSANDNILVINASVDTWDTVAELNADTTMDTGSATFGSGIDAGAATVIVVWQDSAGNGYLGSVSIADAGGFAGDVTQLAQINGYTAAEILTDSGNYVLA
jgi:hypothetical protein